MTIDWSILDKYPADTCECHCGEVYRSHAKAVLTDDGTFALVSRRPCPGCGSDRSLRKVSSEPETMTIGGNSGGRE